MPSSLPADEEPFLIFANRYYLRKLNLDGSNYTLLKQVRLAYAFFFPPILALERPTLDLPWAQSDLASCSLTGLEQCGGFGLRLSAADDLLDRRDHPGQHDPQDVY